MRDNKKSAKLVNMETELLSLYIDGVAELNDDVTIDNKEKSMSISKSPFDVAFKGGCVYALRSILIKYFGHTLEELNEKERIELERKKV